MSEVLTEYPFLSFRYLAFDSPGVQLSLVLLSTLLGLEGAAVNSHLTVRGRDPVSAQPHLGEGKSFFLSCLLASKSSDQIGIFRFFDLSVFDLLLLNKRF